eukprot:CCRYP_018930-RC/>CCRYP_018930-RC protein AED:0.46 eAED:1.00 QI:0/0/0/1/0/0/2/0/246
MEARISSIRSLPPDEAIDLLAFGVALLLFVKLLIRLNRLGDEDGSDFICPLNRAAISFTEGRMRRVVGGDVQGKTLLRGRGTDVLGPSWTSICVDVSGRDDLILLDEIESFTAPTSKRRPAALGSEAVFRFILFGLGKSRFEGANAKGDGVLTPHRSGEGAFSPGEMEFGTAFNGDFAPPPIDIFRGRELLLPPLLKDTPLCRLDGVGLRRNSARISWAEVTDSLLVLLVSLFGVVIGLDDGLSGS